MPLNGRSFVSGFIRLLVICMAFAALYLLVDYLAGLWSFPAILVKVLYTLLVIAAFIFAIDALLSLFGQNFITWMILIALTLGGCTPTREPNPARDIAPAIET